MSIGGGPEFLIPIIICTGMFAMIYGIVYMKSRVNMAMIEKGMNPKINNSGPRPFVYLKYGLLLVGAGIGLFLAYFIDRNISHQLIGVQGQMYYDSDNPAIYFALIGIGGGLGLIISFFIEKRYWLDKKKDMHVE